MAIITNTQILTASDGGQVAVTSVQAEGVETIAPLVFLPGSFTGRKFWLSDKGIGLSVFLAERGYPAWIVERRGMAGSPTSGRRKPRPGVTEHIQFDLPKLQKLVKAATGKAAFWIGHSFGGVLAVRAAAESLDQNELAGLVLFATQFDVGKVWMTPPRSWLPMAIAQVKGDFPGPWAGIGPEDEPAAAIMDNMRWLPKARRDPSKTAGFASISCPVLAIASEGDVVDPAAGCKMMLDRLGSEDKTWLLLGKAQGHAEDYSHAGMVISKPAQQEVWPLLAQWLDEKAGATK